MSLGNNQGPMSTSFTSCLAFFIVLILSIFTDIAQAKFFFFFLFQCRAAFNVNRTLDVRPGRINKKLELHCDYDVKGMILNYYSVCW